MGGSGERINFLMCRAVRSYLGIDFACNGAWDVHLKRVLDNGRKKVNHLLSIIK